MHLLILSRMATITKLDQAEGSRYLTWVAVAQSLESLSVAFLDAIAGSFRGNRAANVINTDTLLWHAIDRAGDLTYHATVLNPHTL